MKILQVVVAFHPLATFGGPMVNVDQISQRCNQLGHEVTILTTNLLSPSQSFHSHSIVDPQDGRRIFYLRCRSLGTYGTSLSLEVFPFLIRHGDSFDVVHIHGYRNFLALTVSLFCRARHIPYVLQGHGTIAPILRRVRWKKVFDRAVGYSMLRNAEIIIATWYREARQVAFACRDARQIVVIPNGIAVEEYEAIPSRGEFRSRYGLNSHPLILFLGRIHRVKGLDVLLKAFQCLQRSIPDVRLAIVGPDDGDLERIRILAKELGLGGSVVFTGPLLGQDKLAAYVDADVYALPSFSENFGYTALEAVMCDTPVVVTETSGCSEYLDTRCSVPYDDVVALEERLRWLLTSREDASMLVEQAKRKIKQELSWDSVVQRVLEVYLQVSENRNLPTGRV